MGGTDRALAVGVVIHAKKGGTASWGHAAVRVLACEHGEISDYEYETYRLGRSAVPRLREAMGDPELVLDAELLRRERGQRFLFRNDDAVDRGYLGDATRRNRELYEIWLPLDGEELERSWRLLDGAYARQLEAFAGGLPLTEGPYRATSTNCTVPVRQVLGLVGLPGAERAFPLAILRDLEERPDVVRVVHPSPHLLARLVREHGGEAAFIEAASGKLQVERHRPVFRGGRRLSDAVVARLDEELLDDLRPVVLGHLRPVDGLAAP